jgi:methionine sulfoxide reductase heme-binding subunit
MPRDRKLRFLKPPIFLLCLLPGIHTAWRVLGGESIDPVADMTHASGDWTLIFLLVTLSVTPLRQLGAPAIIVGLRRMLGLFAYFYALLHFSIYLFLDQMLDPKAIAHDIVRRPFITAGFLAFTLLTPLAITSTNGWMRRLRRNWGRLHRLIYPAAAIGVVHYIWLVKRDLRQPLIYASLLGLLLAWRVAAAARRRAHEKGPGH